MKLKFILYFLVFGMCLKMAAQSNSIIDNKISFINEFQKSSLFYKENGKSQISDYSYHREVDRLNRLEYVAEKYATERQKFEIQNMFVALGRIKNDYLLVADHGPKYLSFKSFISDKERLAMYSYLRVIYQSLEYYDELLLMLPVYNDLVIKNGTRSSERAILSCDMGEILFNMNLYSEAISEFKNCGRDLLFQKQYLYASSQYHDIGQSFDRLHQKDSSLFYYEKASKILMRATASTDREKLYLSYFNQVIASSEAFTRYETANQELGIPIYEKELELAKQVGEPNIRIQSYYRLAYAYNKKGNFIIAQKYIDSSLLKNNKYTYVKLRNKALLLKAQILSGLGNIEESDSIMSTYETFNDSLLQVKASKGYQQNLTKFQLDVKEKQLQEQKIQNAESRRFNVILVACSIILLILAGSILYFYKKTKEDSFIIDKQRSEATVSLKQKEVLLKELHHRVKNNLQVISGLLQLQSSKFDTPEVYSLVNEANRHLHAITLVHEMLYKDETLEYVNMQKYLEILSEKLISVTNQNTKYAIDCNQIKLPIKYVTAIGLILNELIANSLNQSYKDNKGLIKIVLVNSYNAYTLIYQDNSNAIDLNLNNNLGIDLIEMLSEEINGTIDRKIDKGLRYSITFII